MTQEQDFSREQRILDLAVRLQSGEATAEETLEAANSLSFAAGERLRLEQQLERARQVTIDLGIFYDRLRMELCDLCPVSDPSICSAHQPAVGIIKALELGARP